MKVCVVGAGAIGGLLAARIAAAGNSVTVVDVGEHLRAIQKDGLTVHMADGEVVKVRPHAAVSDLAEAGVHDAVILAVKAQVIADVAAGLDHLYHDDTVLVPMQNGIPWWYFQRRGGEHEGRAIETVDPGGVIAARIDPARIIGCVVFPAGEIAAPGEIRHIEGNRFPVGELDGTDTPRVRAIADLFNGAGFKSFVLDDIRSEIWLKLWGNLSFNPISALTHATMVDICRFPETRALAADMMREAQAVAEGLGAHFRVSLEKRIDGAEKVGAHKTSMLQDVEAGRALEIDALIGAVLELATLTGVETPAIRAVHALVKLLDKGIRETHAAVCFRQVA